MPKKAMEKEKEKHSACGCKACTMAENLMKFNTKEHHHEDSHDHTDCHCHEHEHEHDHTDCHCHEDSSINNPSHIHAHEHVCEMETEKGRLIISLSLFLIITLIDHMNLINIFKNSQILRFSIYFIPYIIAGYEVVKDAIMGILRRDFLDEDFLMTIASIGAFATAQYSEACAVMIFFQIGEYFQAKALGKSRKSIKELMDISAEYANRENSDGSIEKIKSEEVKIADILVIKAGEKIPVDGIIISGETELDTSGLTGESVLSYVKEGDQILSGCINGDGLIRMKAEKAYRDSTVSKILKLVEEAGEKKSKTENFITKFARYYTPLVVISALMLAVFPPIITGEWSKWILRACIFLVISCPCALVISVPLAFFGGIGAASRDGILIKGSNYMEQLSECFTVLSDKTGTVTEGEFKIDRIISMGDMKSEEILYHAAVLEDMSTHPIALSIKREYEKLAYEIGKDEKIESLENFKGKGIKAVLENGDIYLIGNRKFIKESGIHIEDKEDDISATAVYLCRNGLLEGILYLSDKVKEGASDAIKNMKKEGIRNFCILTGDRKENAENIKKYIDIDEIYSELLPQEKLEIMEEKIEELPKNKTLAYIGDGINDAPVLRRADIGIAMGTMGSDAAIEAADIVIMDDDLDKIPRAIGISKKTLKIARENIVFALLMKFSILILSVFGLANIWAAVFSDVGVMTLCVLNSMRMLKATKK